MPDTRSRPESAGGWSVILTVADHDQNGFVSLAKWRGMSEAEARGVISAADGMVGDENEPDIKAAPFTFILDLVDPRGDVTDSGDRLLPTQVAMSLAPDEVQSWLNERPNPDAVICRPVPVLLAIDKARGASQ